MASVRLPQVRQHPFRRTNEIRPPRLGGGQSDHDGGGIGQGHTRRHR